MAGKTKHLLHRDGRFYARLVIPKSLRPYLDNKTELRTPLGADRREALRKHPMAVADLMHRITSAERAAARASGAEIAPGRYPMTDAQIARHSYEARLSQDDDARNTQLAYALIGVDDAFAAQLRRGLAGSLSNDELQDLVGHRVDYYRQNGHTSVELGTSEWRRLARAMCESEYEALERVYERHEGDFAGQPKSQLLATAEPITDDEPPVSLEGLFSDYCAARRGVGKGEGAERRWKPVIANLRSHLRHDDARRITKKNLMEWRDKLLLSLSPNTVAKVHLAAVRTLLNWAVQEDRLPSNPAQDVRQGLKKKVTTRPKGYTTEEATKILAASVSYTPSTYASGKPREKPGMSAAKRWVPLLCAFTGARVVEITQMRKEDIRREGDCYVLRITPDAGTVKTGQFRDVPLHPQIFELGFGSFVENAGAGPLFYTSESGGVNLPSARIVADRIGTWLKGAGLVPQGLSANHAWRHRFKTVAREIGASDRITDAICGHASHTAGDDYGDVTIQAKRLVIEALPAFEVAQKGHIGE